MTGNDDDNLSVIETKYVDQGIEQRNVPSRQRTFCIEPDTSLSVLHVITKVCRVLF